MGYLQFLTNLLEDGRVVVPEIGSNSQADDQDVAELLACFERQYRLDLPSGLPQFEAAAGRWAASRFFLACQFAVYRDQPAEAVHKELAAAWDAAATPAVHYSVDLVFRYLPDLTRFAVSASEGDPLVQHLLRWARQWPLSSVGILEVGEVVVDALAGNHALLQLYTDRIIASGDISRLSDERVRQAVRASLGMYPDLAPKIDGALKPYDVPESAL